MTRPALPPGTGHLLALDGMRGLAAISVVLAHYTIRWTEEYNGQSIYPYGDIVPAWLTPGLPVLAYGVNLFFLISGFVMVALLRNSTGLIDFTLRRLSRLWPVLVVCSALTTLAIMASGIHERYDSIAGWEVSPFEFLSSIAFIDPSPLGSLLGKPGFDWVDGAYWTLWVDVRFYVVVAAVYWLFNGPKSFAYAWMAVQAASFCVLIFQSYLNIQLPWAIGVILQPTYLCWFTLGIAASYLFQHEDKRIGLMLGALGLITMIAESYVAAKLFLGGQVVLQIAIYLALLAAFAAAFFRTALTPLLTSPSAIILGLISYPLYIFHQRVGIVLMTELHDLGVPALMTLPVVTVLIVAAAYAIHRLVEKPARGFLLRQLGPYATRVQTRLSFTQFRRKPALPPLSSAHTRPQAEQA